jgi:hypothetical protein
MQLAGIRVYWANGISISILLFILYAVVLYHEFAYEQIVSKHCPRPRQMYETPSFSEQYLKLQSRITFILIILIIAPHVGIERTDRLIVNCYSSTLI